MTTKRNRAQKAYEMYCASLFRAPDWDGLPSREKDAWWDVVFMVDDTAGQEDATTDTEGDAP